MRDADADAVAQVLHGAFRQPDAGAIPTGRGLDLPLTGGRVRSWRRASAGAWVAQVAGYGLVGTVFAVVEPEAAWLAGLGVMPAFRGAGVAAALIDRALAFLADRERLVMGMETAPTAVGAAALYARRGFRIADLTVRVRAASAPLAAQPATGAWRQTAATNLSCASQGLTLSAAAGIRALPRSPQSYLLHGPEVVLLCDPDPLVPVAGGALDLRLVMTRASQLRVIEACVRAAARSALARRLSALEVDLALADGRLSQRLARLGFTPVASTIRLVNNPHAYAAWRRRNGPVGRWSF